MCITHEPAVNGKYENGKIWAVQGGFFLKSYRKNGYKIDRGKFGRFRGIFGAILQKWVQDRQGKFIDRPEEKKDKKNRLEKI